MDAVEGFDSLKVIAHPDVDLALMKFDNYAKLLCDSFPVFAQSSSVLRQGRSICRLGYPFPEFSNYKYESKSDSIEWTPDGQTNTPRFPIDGILTRHLSDGKGKAVGFEVSTPGLRGQSGGPAFDVDGRIVGIQSLTKAHDLNFDVDIKVLRRGKQKPVKESSLLHVGHCIHLDVIKDFMRQNQVNFVEG